MKLTNEDRAIIAEGEAWERKSQTVTDWLLMWGWIFLAVLFLACIGYGLYLYYAIPLGWMNDIVAARGGIVP